ncbi:hypothetical protein ACP70R_015704 [Stipagrostis hirtigluma subsp. patula]
MARAAAAGRVTACTGVGDQFALVAVLRHWQQPAALAPQQYGAAEAEAAHVKHAVQPSFVMPRRTEAPAPRPQPPPALRYWHLLGRRRHASCCAPAGRRASRRGRSGCRRP